MAKKRTPRPESWTYVLESDRKLPAGEQTTFTLRPLTVAERAAALDGLNRTVIEPSGTRTVVSRMHQNALEFCVTHIERVENFPAGAPEAWPADREARLRYLEQLEDAHIFELGDQVFSRSTIEDVAKNS